MSKIENIYIFRNKLLKKIDNIKVSKNIYSYWGDDDEVTFKVLYNNIEIFTKSKLWYSDDEFENDFIKFFEYNEEIKNELCEKYGFKIVKIKKYIDHNHEYYSYYLYDKFNDNIGCYGNINSIEEWIHKMESYFQ